jgi:hypothetical protein
LEFLNAHPLPVNTAIADTAILMKVYNPLFYHDNAIVPIEPLRISNETFLENYVDVIASLNSNSFAMYFLSFTSSNAIKEYTSLISSCREVCKRETQRRK